MHSSYSSDLTPSDYHMFLPMDNIFVGGKFTTREACEHRLFLFIANKDEGFYERDMVTLPSKWQQIVKENGV